mgnify:CR=1 FL=1
MDKPGRPLLFICWILLIVYFALLTRSILFKKGLTYFRQHFASEYRHYSIKEGWKTANTVPFHTIRNFYNSQRLDSDYKTSNLLGNLVGFVPLGLLLPVVWAFFRRWWSILLAGLLVSLGYECTQLFFGLGVFDVDDLILNTAGTLAGYICYRVLWLIFKS